MNIDFANYVRESSFNLTLSSAMIGALLVIRRDQDNPRLKHGFCYSRMASNALYRRGLIIPTSQPVEKAWTESPAWPYIYELTTAGKLVTDLLIEAGFKYPDHGLPAEEEVSEVEVTLK